jgi:hypothetical protein
MVIYELPQITNGPCWLVSYSASPPRYDFDNRPCPEFKDAGSVCSFPELWVALRKQQAELRRQENRQLR